MGTKTKVGGLVVTAAVCSFITFWEGDKAKPYFDVGGVPTACAGVTKGIDMTHLYDKEECASLNLSEMQRHANDVSKCVKVELSDLEATALISIAYNVGAASICRSTLIRKMNNGEYYCDEYLKWDKVGNTVVRGLANRRAAERTLCLKGSKRD